MSGRVEKGESFERAALREVAEETALDIALGRPFDTFSFVRETGEELLGVTFAAKCIGGELALTDEHQEARWVTQDELGDIDLSPAVGAAIALFWTVGPSALL